MQALVLRLERVVVGEPDGVVEDARHDEDDGDEEVPPPVLAAAGAPGEGGVLVQKDAADGLTERHGVLLT